MDMFTVVLNILCNLDFQDLSEGIQVSEGSAGSLPPVTFMNGHNIRPTSCRPCDWFRTPATETPWVVVPNMYGTHYKHNSLVSSSVFNNDLSLLIYGYMSVGTLGHMPRYMDRMSNNNKILINNSSCCFVIRVVYTQVR